MSVQTAGGGPPPRTEDRAAALAGTWWRTTLRLESVADADDFFDLGGDSLYMLEVCDLAYSDGVEIEPATLVDAPTFGEFRRVVAGVLAAGPADPGH